jgi:MFS family permease
VEHLNYLKTLKSRYSLPVRVRLFGEFLTGVTGGMLAPFLIIYINDQLGGNVLLSMMIVGLQPLTELFFTIIAGGMTDRFGRKKIIIVALILQSLTMVGFSLAHTVWLFSGLYILNGICRSLYIPAARAQIAETTDDDRLSEVFAVLSTLGSIGFTFGPTLGFLVYSYHPAIVFGFEALALFIYCLIFWWKVPETAPQTKLSEAKNRKRQFEARTFLSHHYSILILMVLTLPISFFHAQTETNFRLYIEDIFQHYLSVLAILSTVQAVMMMVLEIGLVKWSEKFTMQRITVISYGAYAVVAFLYGFSTELWLFIAAQFILTIGQTIGINHFLRFVSQMAPENHRGLYFAIYGSHWDISRTFGPFIGGLFLTHFGGDVLFYFAMCLLIIGGIGQFFFVKAVQGSVPLKALKA